MSHKEIFSGSGRRFPAMKKIAPCRRFCNTLCLMPMATLDFGIIHCLSNTLSPLSKFPCDSTLCLRFSKHKDIVHHFILPNTTPTGCFGILVSPVRFFVVFAAGLNPSSPDWPLSASFPPPWRDLQGMPFLSPQNSPRIRTPAERRWGDSPA